MSRLSVLLIAAVLVIVGCSDQHLGLAPSDDDTVADDDTAEDGGVCDEGEYWMQCEAWRNHESPMYFMLDDEGEDFVMAVETLIDDDLCYLPGAGSCENALDDNDSYNSWIQDTGHEEGVDVWVQWCEQISFCPAPEEAE